MKKITVFMLAMILVIGALTSCSPKVDPANEISISAKAEGSIFSGISDGSIALTVKFNPDWITVADNTEYNGELAAFAALISTDSYFREKDLAKGTQNRIIPDVTDEYSFSTLMTALGFTETEHVESYKAKTYDTDTNDSATMNLAHLAASDRDLYVVALRGCFSAGEWMSAFDPGADGEDGHPDWKNRANMKGVDVAANRALEFINAFVAAHDDSGKPNCILITGHSRGAAIAEIVGAAFEDNEEFESCTYAFNSMAVTTDKKAESYRTIFNIFDSGDLYTAFLPFSQETFYRYGRTLTKDIASDTEVRDAIESLKGLKDYTAASRETFEGYNAVFGKRFEGRAALAEKKTITEDFGTDSAAADARLAELESFISAEKGLGLEGLVSVAKAENDGKISVVIRYSNAAALISLGKVFTYGKAAADALCSMFREDKDLCAVVEYVIGHSDEMSGGHLMINSYVLCGFLED